VRKIKLHLAKQKEIKYNINVKSIRLRLFFSCNHRFYRTW